MPQDDELEETYRARKRRQEESIAAAYGVSPEELELAREIAPEAFDLTDPVLQTKRTFDLFRSARSPAEKVRAARKLEKNAKEVIDVVEKLSKLFR